MKKPCLYVDLCSSNLCYSKIHCINFKNTFIFLNNYTESVREEYIFKMHQSLCTWGEGNKEKTGNQKKNNKIMKSKRRALSRLGWWCVIEGVHFAQFCALASKGRKYNHKNNNKTNFFKEVYIYFFPPAPPFFCHL